MAFGLANRDRGDLTGGDGHRQAFHPAPQQTLDLEMSTLHQRPPGTSRRPFSVFSTVSSSNQHPNTTTGTTICTPSTPSATRITGVPPPSARLPLGALTATGPSPPVLFRRPHRHRPGQGDLWQVRPGDLLPARRARPARAGGVKGGELLLSGRIVRSKRPCGHPPKHPRPELIVDEFGPVGSVA
jgi:hypothetical protein